MKQIVRIKIRNEFSKVVTLLLEPWGEDYGMLPNDEFEIIAKVVDEHFYFQVDFGENITVWAEGQVIDIGVYQNNKLLECGYNRLVENT